MILTSLATTTSKDSRIYMLNCFDRFLKRSLCTHLMQVKLLLVNFYLNGGLHAVSIGKLSERMSDFWTVWFSKTESEPNLGFLHIPTSN